MIQLSNIEKLEAKDISKLVTLIEPELNKRKQLYLRYKRKSKNSELISESKDDGNGTISFEKYIIDVASGYLGGKEPKYIVENTSDESKKNIIQSVLKKKVGDEKYQKEMEVIIDYISNYNDDDTEHYNLVKDVLATSASYEIMYENEENEIVYSKLDPLQTIAIWDYGTPKNLIGLVRYYQETDINEKIVNVVELTDKYGTRCFKASGNSSNYTEEKQKDANGNVLYNNHNWGDVPALAIEQVDGMALFEPVIELIKKYEQLLQNTTNTFQYNDEAKLKVTGYAPSEPLTIKDEKGNTIENQARKSEDEALLKAKVFYTPNKDGNIEWIEKNVSDGAIQNTLKTIIDLILMTTGVPNVTDLGFTKADNASAIDRKFFTLEQMTIDIVKQIKMAYKRRWELIFNRINTKKDTKYDFRDVNVELQKNLPANENEVVESWLKLRGLVSDETIIEHLPYGLDAIVEKGKIENQEKEQLEKDIYKQDEFNKVNSKYEKFTNGKKDDIIENKKGEE